MVWTKDEVDKYVVQVERNCKSAHEVSIFHSLFIGEISLHSFLYWRSPFLNCSVTWKGLPSLDCTEKLLTMRLRNGKFILVIVNVAFCVPFPVRSTSHTVRCSFFVCKTCVWCNRNEREFKLLKCYFTYSHLFTIKPGPRCWRMFKLVKVLLVGLKSII